MRRVASTVNVISICVDGQPMGITATAVAPVSLDPPSLLVCINQAASLHAPMGDMSHFRINVLHRDQEEIARMFADRSQHRLRFLSGWDIGSESAPRLLDAQATILCRRTDSHSFGTHSIFIGIVEEAASRDASRAPGLSRRPLRQRDKIGTVPVFLFGEKMGGIAHRLQLDRVAGRIAQEHRRLLARLTVKRTVGGMTKSTPAASSLSATPRHCAMSSTAPKCGTGTFSPSTALVAAPARAAGSRWATI